MAVMGSRLNGQSFDFNGYRPIDAAERAKKIKQLETRVYSENQTQIFIETPYRNNKMLEDLIKNCRPQTRLCVASNITCDDESIITMTLQDWKKAKPELSKVPAIFLIYK